MVAGVAISRNILPALLVGSGLKLDNVIRPKNEKLILPALLVGSGLKQG